MDPLRPSRTFPASRLMSLGTLSYAVYALARPRHLGRALTKDPVTQASYDAVAQTYGVRDLAVSGAALVAPNAVAVTTAMALRAALDVADGVLLATRTSGGTRAKVLAVTLGWATLNVAALLADRRRAG